jgi:cellulose synthase (UDP-forming)
MAPGYLQPGVSVFSWLIWGAEVFGYLTAVLHIFMVSRLTSPVATSPQRSYGRRVRSTYNESVNLLRHTLLAATRMEYPHQTWLLDDGNRPEMAALAKELDCRYLARTENTDAKAGNLNHALAQSHADFVAVFDADHVPHKDFLNKTLGFFHNEKVAFVQTPQDFYNLDSYQHRRHKRLSYIWTEQSLFFRVIQRGKDRWNAAYFSGSCAVLRRSALDKIGGFATGTVTEDLHTSIRLHKKGYQAVYYPESLAFGLAPDSVRAFLLQRLRWGQGAMQVWRKEGILFTRGLTLPQRLNYLASVLTYFDGWQKRFSTRRPSWCC